MRTRSGAVTRPAPGQRRRRRRARRPGTAGRRRGRRTGRRTAGTARTASARAAAAAGALRGRELRLVLGAGEQRDDGGADGVGEVHAAGVVGDRDPRAGDHRDQARHVEPAGQVDAADGPHELALLLGPDHRDRQAEAAGHLGEALHRVAPRRAGRPRREDGVAVGQAGLAPERRRLLAGRRRGRRGAGACPATGRRRTRAARARGRSGAARRRGARSQCDSTLPPNSLLTPTRTGTPGEVGGVGHRVRRLGEGGEDDDGVVAAQPLDQGELARGVLRQRAARVLPHGAQDVHLVDVGQQRREARRRPGEASRSRPGTRRESAAQGAQRGRDHDDVAQVVQPHGEDAAQGAPVDGGSGQGAGPPGAGWGDRWDAGALPRGRPGGNGHVRKVRVGAPAGTCGRSATTRPGPRRTPAWPTTPQGPPKDDKADKDEGEGAPRAKEKEKAAKAKEKERAAKQKEKEKAAKAKEKEKAAKAKEKEKAAKAKEKERAAKAEGEGEGREGQGEGARRQGQGEGARRQGRGEGEGAGRRRSGRAADDQPSAPRRAGAGTGPKSRGGVVPPEGVRPARSGSPRSPPCTRRAGSPRSSARRTPSTRSTKRPTLAASFTTRDHDVIRRWAESRGGVPADVRGTGDGDQAAPASCGSSSATRPTGSRTSAGTTSSPPSTTSDVDFLYQEFTKDGGESRFHKIVRADD